MTRWAQAEYIYHRIRALTKGTDSGSSVIDPKHTKDDLASIPEL